MSTAAQKVCLPAIFTCSHITFVIVYSFYFLCFGFRRNEFNSLWEGLRGRRADVYCCSESMPARHAAHDIRFEKRISIVEMASE